MKVKFTWLSDVPSNIARSDGISVVLSEASDGLFADYLAVAETALDLEVRFVYSAGGGRSLHKAAPVEAMRPPF